MSEIVELYGGGWYPAGSHPRRYLLHVLLWLLEQHLTRQAAGSMMQHYAREHARRHPHREAADG